MKRAERTVTTMVPADSQMTGSMDQIRDILFGAQKREADQRFAALDRTLDQMREEQEAALLKQQKSFDRQLEELRASFADRVKDLAQRVDDVETAARRELQTGLRDAAEKLADQAKRLQADLADLGAATKKRLDAMQEDTQESFDQITEEKTANEDLGNLLVELGMRLKGEAAFLQLASAVGRDG